MAPLSFYRRARVGLKQMLGIEPRVPIGVELGLEHHGDLAFGWSIPADCLRADSVVVDIGLGENISFSTSLIDRYQCTVHGFDPTPRAIAYVERLAYPGFVLHKVGVAARGGRAMLHLPRNTAHVSGSLTPARHTGARQVEVMLITLGDVAALLGADRIDLLKIDIEGAEYDLLLDEGFARHAPRIGILCIEFHHRWREHGRAATERVVERLAALGFRCAWSRRTTNEEFTFVRPAGRNGG